MERVFNGDPSDVSRNWCTGNAIIFDEGMTCTIRFWASILRYLKSWVTAASAVTHLSSSIDSATNDSSVQVRKPSQCAPGCGCLVNHYTVFCDGLVLGSLLECWKMDVHH